MRTGVLFPVCYRNIVLCDMLRMAILTNLPKLNDLTCLMMSFPHLNDKVIKMIQGLSVNPHGESSLDTGGQKRLHCA